MSQALQWTMRILQPRRTKWRISDLHGPPNMHHQERGSRGYYAQDRVTAQKRGHVEKIYATTKKKDQITSKSYPVRIFEPETPKRSMRKNPISSSDLRSPLHIPKDLLSSRRVEFADELFSFKPSEIQCTCKPGSRCESPTQKVS